MPYAAGSVTDITARALAAEMAPILKATVVVDNKTGAGQTVAASHVYRAAPDGLTLMLANLPNAVAPSVAAKLPFKSFSDFAPVADVMSISMMLATSNETGVTSLDALAAKLRASPGELSFGSGGVGSVLHLTSEFFNRELGTRSIHVPFKGGNQVMLELAANRLSYSFLTMNGMEFAQQGKIRAIGITSQKRDPQYPDLPTLSELGLTKFSAGVGFVVIAPKGTSQEALNVLNAAVHQAASSRSFAKMVQGVGGVTIAPATTSRQAGESVARHERQWQQVIHAANIQLE